MNSKTNFNADAAQQESDAKLNDIEKNLDKKVTIAVIGRVSAGKSSLINALFNRDRSNPLAEVASISGKTTELKRFKLGKKVEIMDSPGLGDTKDENSAVTRAAMIDVDVGVLVLCDSADVAQKQNYDLLKENCRKVFVVLNKIDMYDKKKAALKDVIEQWRQVLDLAPEEQIFETCTDGYDPSYDPDMELDIRGVDELKNGILEFLKKYGKDLILAKEMEKKSVTARRIIYGALAAVAVEAFVPGSAIYITATQAGAIMSIHYVYTGEVLSKKSAVAAIPLFASQSIGSTAFLWAKSILPPTGILDVAAAVVAATVTLAMLSTVNWIYENGYNLDDKTELQAQFNKFKKLLDDPKVKEIITDIIKSRNMSAIKSLIAQFVK